MNLFCENIFENCRRIFRFLKLGKIGKKVFALMYAGILFKNALPSIFSIEINVTCNLKCPECALGGNLITRKKDCLSFEEFKVIADKVRPFVKYMYIMIWGEPLLNKDLIAMIKYASKFTKTAISTNGMLLTHEKAEQLITSGLSELIVSIDGATQAVYEKYRVGGNLQKAFESLKILNNLNIKYGNKVRIIPQFIVFKHNQHEMDSFKKICNSIGLKSSFKSPYIHRGSIFLNSDLQEYTRKSYKDKSEVSKAMRECQDTRKVFTILLEGTVVACCYDYNGITNFGNIYKQEVLEIWNSQKYMNFRRVILQGNTPEFCLQNCLQYRLQTDSK